jgi:hypothetical protein
MNEEIIATCKYNYVPEKGDTTCGPIDSDGTVNWLVAGGLTAHGPPNSRITGNRISVLMISGSPI